MTSEALQTLLYPFEAGHLAPPAVDARCLFLNAAAGFRLPEGWPAASVLAVQGFRPDFLALKRAGIAVQPRLESGNAFDVALVLCGRHRGANERHIAEALERTVAGGLIVVAGGKEDGAASLRKRVAAVLPLAGQLPKFHGLVFWLSRPANAAAAIAALRPSAGERPLLDGRFWTEPGMFSHDRIDAGSALLGRNLPADLSGAVADFCAGWGYLAAEIVRRSPAVARLDLYEADFDALAAARANLAGSATPIRFLWHDLVGEPLAERYDTVVMNPPFHSGRRADPGLGRAMIAAAAAALRRGGRLVMVANRQLPYEAELQARFGAYQEVARDNDFKVLTARR